MFAKEYSHLLNKSLHHDRTWISQTAAKHVNLTAQSLLKQEHLMINQLDSMDGDDYPELHSDTTSILV